MMFIQHLRFIIVNNEFVFFFLIFKYKLKLGSGLPMSNYRKRWHSFYQYQSNNMLRRLGTEIQPELKLKIQLFNSSWRENSIHI